jgi:diguanylate cyclase (GGDEF)-like protein
VPRSVPALGTLHPPSALRVRGRLAEPYFWAVGLVGSLVGAGWVGFDLAGGRIDPSPQLGLFALLVVLAELRPLTINRGSHTDAITTSTLFAFAILLEWGPGAAILAQCTASLLDDARDRPFSPATTLFNVGQYALALAGGALALVAFDVDTSFVDSAELLAVAIAGVIFLLLNHVLPGISFALAEEAPLTTSLTSDLAFQASITGSLLALSPVVLVATERSLFLAPMLAIPMFVVHRSAQVSVEKRHLALHDSLTGLPNRAYFQQEASEHIEALDPRHAVAALVVLDIDDFKEVNDALGHDAGDELLCQVAVRLREAVGESGFLSRLGADEFAVLLPTVEDEHVPERLAERVLATFESAFHVDDFSFDLRVSAGIAVFPEDGLDVRTMLQHADIALFAAKRTRSGYQRYEAARDRNSRRRLRLMSELRQAARDGSLLVHYQPQADLASGRIVGAEALVRWQHRQYGMVSPADFVPLAEQTGVIREVTQHVLRRAVEQQRAWRELGHDLQVAVNISACDLRSPDFVQELRTLLAEHEVAAASIELEITEHGLIDDLDGAVTVLEELRQLGVKLAVDDYGTGYSSIRYLSRLPVDTLKIDRSFVTSMTTVPADAIIVRSTIDLAERLGLKVVAEGVETASVWQSLRESGCARAQGFYLSRPVAPDVLLLQLDQQPGADPARGASADGLIDLSSGPEP